MHVCCMINMINSLQLIKVKLNNSTDRSQPERQKGRRKIGGLALPFQLENTLQLWWYTSVAKVCPSSKISRQGHQNSILRNLQWHSAALYDTEFRHDLPLVISIIMYSVKYRCFSLYKQLQMTVAYS